MSVAAGGIAVVKAAAAAAAASIFARIENLILLAWLFR